MTPSLSESIFAAKDDDEELEEVTDDEELLDDELLDDETELELEELDAQPPALSIATMATAS
jgi:hypothetical protein